MLVLTLVRKVSQPEQSLTPKALAPARAAGPRTSTTRLGSGVAAAPAAPAHAVGAGAALAAAAAAENSVRSPGRAGGGRSGPQPAPGESPAGEGAGADRNLASDRRGRSASSGSGSGSTEGIDEAPDNRGLFRPGVPGRGARTAAEGPPASEQHLRLLEPMQLGQVSINAPLAWSEDAPSREALARGVATAYCPLRPGDLDGGSALERMWRVGAGAGTRFETYTVPSAGLRRRRRDDPGRSRGPARRGGATGTSRATAASEQVAASAAASAGAQHGAIPLVRGACDQATTSRHHSTCGGATCVPPRQSSLLPPPLPSSRPSLLPAPAVAITAGAQAQAAPAAAPDLVWSVAPDVPMRAAETSGLPRA